MRDARGNFGRRFAAQERFGEVSGGDASGVGSSDVRTWRREGRTVRHRHEVEREVGQARSNNSPAVCTNYRFPAVDPP